MSDKLNEIFDVVPELVASNADASNTALIYAESASIVTAEPVQTADEKLEADFETARTNIQNLTKDVTEAAKSAILLAQSGDSPRAYEVVATMLTAIVNANKELVNLHKAKQDAAPQKAESSEAGGVNIEKAVFVGRASDLLRELRQLQKPK
jgi:predicted translin family RNA/ssDNA-binding protein